jgi:hypothetical protein
MLCNNVGGGVMDLVWGPELELTETKTDIHHFLGNTKYEPVLTSIYAGLGIPPTLTGAAGQGGGGFTNNFISLKTMTERLQYGRDALVAFWEEEVRLVQRAMGFRFPAQLTFDRMVLSDEAAEKALLLDLWDRNLISDETVRQHFKEDPDVEQARVRREWRAQQNQQVPLKVSPFHNANGELDLKKTFAAQGMVTPSQVGLELDPKKAGETTLVDQQAKIQQKAARTDMAATKQDQDHQYRTERLQLRHGVHPLQQPAQPGQPGRPQGAKDSGPRKQKRVLPRSKADASDRAVFLDTLAWADRALADIGRLAAPAYLKALKKKTLRELSQAENRAFEEYKFYALCQVDPFAELTARTLAGIGGKALTVPAAVDELLKTTVAKHRESRGEEPTVEDLRKYRAGVYALWRGDYPEDPAA